MGLSHMVCPRNGFLLHNKKNIIIIIKGGVVEECKIHSYKICHAYRDYDWGDYGTMGKILSEAGIRKYTNFVSYRNISSVK